MRCNERLVVRVLIFERGGEGSGDVFAGDLTPPPELLGHIYGASTLIFGQAARTDDGVVQTTVPQSFVGAGLGAEIRTHRLGAPLGVARAHGAEHQVAAHPASLRGLDELDGPTVVHRLLARIPAPRSGGEHDGVAPLDRPSDPPSTSSASRSTTTASAPSASTSPVCSSLRTSPLTSWPSATSIRTRRLAVLPCAPATRTLKKRPPSSQHFS